MKYEFQVEGKDAADIQKKAAVKAVEFFGHQDFAMEVVATEDLLATAETLEGGTVPVKRIAARVDAFDRVGDPMRGRC